ncbi:MAG TPA: rRNA pseudouridine synthase [Candidatus Eisenbacteria bacterium]|uniref:Pseudouridine synthase n=1 Tax=Eiseniibacteriota bacterium TaxID=2212470 RepID=A0A7V2AUS2_UNCEI|nr:rRNA pseudouridine synthase [Candidatus Eisenbacteria bacterium]
MKRLLRINRYLAAAGFGSRRACDELIRNGDVRVNGEKVPSLSLLVDPERDEVTVNGVAVEGAEPPVLLVLNKPAGVMSTSIDTHGRRTVVDIAREAGYTERLYPVGRLDLDTSGIIIITNDGDLAYRLTHPRYKVEKTYRVVVRGEVEVKTAEKLASGIDIGGFKTRPCSVRLIGVRDGATELEVRLKEGRKRQIRRMFDRVGHGVVELRRIAIGDLAFDDLDAGGIRPLTVEEERRLRELSGLA